MGGTEQEENSVVSFDEDNLDFEYKNDNWKNECCGGKCSCCWCLPCCDDFCSFETQLMTVIVGCFIPVGYIPPCLTSVLPLVMVDLRIGLHNPSQGLNANFWQQGFLIAAVFLGAGLSSWFLRGLSTAVGRVRALYIGFVAQFTGGVCCAAANGFSSFFVGRLLCGGAMGLITSSIPGILVEMAPPNRRGYYGALAFVVSGLGVLTALALGIPSVKPSHDLQYIDFFQQFWWRLTSAINSILAVIGIASIAAAKVADTPFMLLLNDKDVECKKLLFRIHRTREGYDLALGDAQDAVALFRYNIKQQLSWGTICASAPARNTLLGISFMLSLHDLTGFGIILATSTFILLDAGMDGIMVGVTGLFIGLGQTLGVLPAVFMSDKFGRKPLFIAGYIGQLIADLPTALFYIIEPEHDAVQWLALYSCILHPIAFQFGSGSLGMLHAGEAFPAILRGQLTGICVGTLWMTAFIATLFSGLIPRRWLFLVLSCVDAFAIGYVAIFMKETKGISSERSPYFAGAPNQFYKPLTDDEEDEGSDSERSDKSN